MRKDEEKLVGNKIKTKHTQIIVSKMNHLKEEYQVDIVYLH